MKAMGNFYDPKSFFLSRFFPEARATSISKLCVDLTNPFAVMPIGISRMCY